jgi:hypothetical protein
MIEEVVYPSKEIPAHLKWQILSFLRMEWPEGFTGPNRLRDWISRDEDHPISFMLVENDVLISHTEVLWKYLEHEKQAYKVYGLAGVFTYPSFRRLGHGTRAVTLATDYIDRSDADIGVVFTQSHLKDFYQNCGWNPVEKQIFLVGSKENPVFADDILLMRFLSDEAKRSQQLIESTPVYFGEDPW